MIGKCNTGGENVTPEVTTQTPIIQNITEALVGKVQGANITPETVLKGYKGYKGQELIEGTYEPNGQYVWKRYNYTPGILYTNPSFKMEATTGASKLVLNNCTFDCTKITDWKTFFDGFAYNTNVRLQNSTKFYWWVDSSTTYSISGFNALSSTSCELTLASGYTVSSSYAESGRKYTYSGTKTIKEEIKIFMGYVVSDSESAYPDGDIQGEYLYEKTNLLDLGWTRYAIDYITPTSDIELKNTPISHSLGISPKYVYIEALDNFTNSTSISYLLRFAGCYSLDNSINSCVSKYRTYSGDNTNYSTFKVTSNSISNIVSGTLKSGIKYKIVTVG